MIELTKENVLMNIIQEIKDLVYGGLTHRNMKTIRTAYVVCSEDSLDADHPMLVPFTMPAGTTKIVQVRVNFFIKPFRAYSKTVQSSEQQTTSDGGGGTYTSTSGGGSTPTTGISTKSTNAVASISVTWHSSPDGWLIMDNGGIPVITQTPVAPYNHQHTVTIPSHQHSVDLPNHSHTIEPHSHDIDFGIYEYSGSPTITFSVSKDNGGLFVPVGTYTQNQLHVEITNLTDYRSVNFLKFETTTLTRISTQIEIKVDMSR